MQFKHPELLYALFLLLIPIIVHLFQLRKFKNVAFTNVAFLKEAIIQTRKSSQIKKWLILLTRLLLFAAIIFAFAQPFTSKIKNINAKHETVIYIDNSFSMQAKGNQGELLKRAIQDIISNVPEDEKISILSNSTVFKNTTIKAIKNDLLQLGYTSNSLTPKAALLKIKTIFEANNETQKNIVFISDFQENETPFTPKLDSLTNLNLVKLEPLNTNNISVDSVFVSGITASNIDLTVVLTSNGKLIENIPVSLFNDDNLIAKTSTSIENKIETTFSLPVNTKINGKIVIDDASLQFDNTLFFNININEKINILSINQKADDGYLKRIYTNDEFSYTSTDINALNYNEITNQRLIILNELDQIPSSLSIALKSFTNEGGAILVIPSENITKPSYDTLLINYNMSLTSLVETEKRITTINYDHPLYVNGVFEKQVSNFQYPKVNSFYRTNTTSSILKYEDGVPFLSQNKNVFVFSSALNETNSNFQNSPLIVPTLYNIGKFSLNIPELYFTIGKQNSFDVPVMLQQDDILSLVKEDVKIIPRQQQFNKKVVVNTQDIPEVSGIYSITNKDEIFSHVTYNYNRNESVLNYLDISKIENATKSNSIADVFNVIKSGTKVNALWKWFVIFALVLLIIEMLILKYFK